MELDQKFNLPRPKLIKLKLILNYQHKIINFVSNIGYIKTTSKRCWTSIKPLTPRTFAALPILAIGTNYPTPYSAAGVSKVILDRDANGV